LSLLGSQLRDQGDGILRVRSGGNTVTFDGGDQVGIGTTAPGPGLMLDVNGQIGVSSNPAVLSLLGSQLRDQGDGILRVRSGGNTVTFDGNDNVGIGTAAPGALLDVNGDALIGGALTVNGMFHNPSDARLKRDIRPLSHALDRLLSLRGIEFEWSREDLARLRPGRQVGLIADEVEPVFPAWVSTDAKTGLKLLSTQGYEAVVIEAVRELSRRIDVLESERRAVRQLTDRLDALERENRALRDRLERIPEPPPPAGAPSPRRRRPRSTQ
jgi:hypothetical protein